MWIHKRSLDSQLTAVTRELCTLPAIFCERGKMVRDGQEVLSKLGK